MDHDHGFDHNNEVHSPGTSRPDGAQQIMDKMLDWWRRNQNPTVPFKPGLIYQPTTPSLPPNTPFYPNQTIVGTCSLCGGPVGVPTIWGSVTPAVPTCLHCRAVKKDNGYGPTIDMRPATGVTISNKTGD